MTVHRITVIYLIIHLARARARSLGLRAVCSDGETRECLIAYPDNIEQMLPAALHAPEIDHRLEIKVFHNRR